MIVPLADLKSHLRIDGDYMDFEIAMFGQAAERMVSQYIDRPIYQVGSLPDSAAAGYDPYQIEASGDIVVVIKQLVHDMNEQRGTTGGAGEPATLPLSARAMLAPYRVFARGGT